ncbi:MAG TPA: hypothetical protein VIM06_01250 [Rhodanobacter sp.]
MAHASARPDPARHRRLRTYTRALIDELSQLSPAFHAMWLEHDVRAHGEGTKHIQHPTLD